MSRTGGRLDVVLLTEERYARPEPSTPFVRQLLREDELVAAALEREGLRCERIAWSDPGFDWRTTRAAVFRSTWDYHLRFGEFSAWLARAERLTRLVNAPPLVRWNADKRYLLELAGRGIDVVPTRVLEAGARPRLDVLLDELGWSEAVVKPVVSASAHETHRLTSDGAAALEPRLHALLERQPLLLQPFRREIVDDGELSLVVIDGRFTHAVRKVPARGDFRVQDDHGGTVQPHAASADEIRFAEAAAAAAPIAPAYARVDCVRTSSGPMLMELEAIEPELFFRFEPAGAERLARRIARELASGGPTGT